MSRTHRLWWPAPDAAALVSEHGGTNEGSPAGAGSPRRAAASRGAGHPRARPIAREPDTRLQAALAAGNGGLAIELLMKMYGPAVDRYCRQMLGADGDGEDARQIVFIQAFEAIRCMSRVEKPRAWLFGIARHRCLDLLRRRRRSPSPASAEELEREVDRDQPAASMNWDAETTRALEESLDELDPRSRTVVLLRFRDQLSFDEISRLTGDTPGALRVRVARALRALRRSMEEKEGESP